MVSTLLNLEYASCQIMADHWLGLVTTTPLIGRKPCNRMRDCSCLMQDHGLCKKHNIDTFFPRNNLAVSVLRIENTENGCAAMHRRSRPVGYGLLSCYCNGPFLVHVCLLFKASPSTKFPFVQGGRMAQSVSARPWCKRSWVRFPDLASLFRLLSFPCS